MSHIPYYGEEETPTEEKSHVSYFGPWTNRHGYKMEFAAIDDMFMLKTVRPNRKKIVTYHWTEESLEERISLNNQDRYF